MTTVSSSRTPHWPVYSPKLPMAMTTPLYTTAHSTSILKIKEMFLGLFIRHILVEKDGDYIGLLSIGDVLRAGLVAKDLQIKELNAIGSWEYYENWGWPRKKE